MPNVAAKYTLGAWFLRVMRPVTILMGKIRMPYSKKLIHSHHYRELTKNLMPGTVILTRTRGELSTLVIPGYWKHAAIYYEDNDGGRWVIEAIGTGVRKTDLIDFMMHTDFVLALTPTFCDAMDMQFAAEWALKQVGKAYDFYLETSLDAFYCSELCLQAYYQTLGAEKVPFKLRTRSGVPSVTPDDFSKAVVPWKTLFDSKLCA